jgi:hypothetical protein
MSAPGKAGAIQPVEVRPKLRSSVRTRVRGGRPRLPPPAGAGRLFSFGEVRLRSRAASGITAHNFRIALVSRPRRRDWWSSSCIFR